MYITPKKVAVGEKPVRKLSKENLVTFTGFVCAIFHFLMLHESKIKCTCFEYCSSLFVFL